MKYLVFLLIFVSSLANASGYNSVTGQLFADPTPFNEPDGGKVDDQRQPYPHPDDNPDYQNDDRGDAWYGSRQGEEDYYLRSCQTFLTQHSYWR